MSSRIGARAGIDGRLASLIRIPTVSAERAERDREFTELPEELARLYPLVHEHLEHERIDGTGLLFRWRGASAQEPLVLMAHWDVVPAPAQRGETGWRQDPFSGDIVEESGEHWVVGRGALDDKGPLVVLLDAVENLLEAGFTPERDIWIVLGGDEEVMGGNAKAMSDALRQRISGQPWLVLDEGGAVTDRPLPVVDGRCAMIGLAEKGVLTVRLDTSGAGGHASAPDPDAPISRITQALARIERNPMPPRLTRAVSAMLAAFAPLTTGVAGRLLGSAGRAGGVTARALAAVGGEPAALVRTTVAATRLQAGSADNVIATAASATLNCRILPGETVSSVCARIRRRVRDDRISITVLEGHDPSPESPVDDRFDALGDALALSWPGTAPVPYLMMAASDSRHFHSWCTHVYRFAPLLMDAQQRASIHGENERVRVDSLIRGERFHRELILSRGGSWTGSETANA